MKKILIIFSVIAVVGVCGFYISELDEMQKEVLHPALKISENIKGDDNSQKMLVNGISNSSTYRPQMESENEMPITFLETTSFELGTTFSKKASANSGELSYNFFVENNNKERQASSSAMSDAYFSASRGGSRQAAGNSSFASSGNIFNKNSESFAAGNLLMDAPIMSGANTVDPDNTLAETPRRIPVGNSVPILLLMSFLFCIWKQKH